MENIDNPTCATHLPAGRPVSERNSPSLHPSNNMFILKTEQVFLLILYKLARFQALTKTAGDTANSLFLARTYLLLKTN